MQLPQVFTYIPKDMDCIEGKTSMILESILCSKHSYLRFGNLRGADFLKSKKNGIRMKSGGDQFNIKLPGFARAKVKLGNSQIIKPQIKSKT